MIELLRDPVWQFAGVVAAAFAILVSVAIYFAQRVRKDLSFEVVRNGQILTIDEESVGKLQLVFDGQPVRNARLLEVRIANAGNQPITPADFVRSLTFSLNAEAIVLSAVVVETRPSNLSPGLNFAASFRSMLWRSMLRSRKQWNAASLELFNSPGVSTCWSTTPPLAFPGQWN